MQLDYGKMSDAEIRTYWEIEHLIIGKHFSKSVVDWLKKMLEMHTIIN
jgi:hypothetical protein